jgi:lipid A disaccharide synthetase
MILVYKGNPLAYQIVMKVLLLPYIGLPNILHCIPDVNHPDANVLPPMVPELLQDNVNPVAITNAILPLLDSNSQEYQSAKSAFAEIQQKLQPNGKPAAQHIADTLLNA